MQLVDSRLPPGRRTLVNFCLVNLSAQPGAPGAVAFAFMAATVVAALLIAAWLP